MGENEERCCENCYYWSRTLTAKGWGYCEIDIGDLTLSTQCCERWEDKDE